MKAVLLLLAVGLLTLSVYGAASLLSHEGPREIAIMTTADLHGHIFPYANDTGASVGGIERIASAKDAIAADVDGWMLLSAGDDLTGPLYATYGGEPELKAMSLAGYTAACPGNHEFDYGVAHYLNATRHAGFPLLSANLEIGDADLAAVIRPSTIVEVDGIRVGLFGLITPDLALITNPGPNVAVDPDYVGTARDEVKVLRDEGADIVVTLSHMGAACDEDLARQVEGIDLIVGGHDHTYVCESVDGPDGWTTLIVHDGSQGECLGVLRCTITDDGIEDWQWETVPMDESVGSDPAVREYLAPFREAMEKQEQEAIGESTVPIDAVKAHLRTREMPLGDLVADAWLAWFDKAEVAVVNSGGIRGDRVFPAGPITRGMLAEIFPFGNEVVVVSMNGTEVRRMFEMSASALGPDFEGIQESGFLQVGGVRVVIDPAMPAYAAVYDKKAVQEVRCEGSRVQSVLVWKDGAWVPVADEGVYTVLVNEYIAGGGDGYALFADIPEERKLRTGIKVIEAVEAYVRARSPLAPVTDGRFATSAGSGSFSSVVVPA
ncbi:bifunctional metallophosphatase/5'-nucleotidase [Methanofollis formosanus]|uniref:Bifunctional metallophosphatase/5'-nucleotidase n=1 Tax=Methanofollis formosanus TaxID=299308 RepID=A0A8G1EHS8_9EURY|nr:bifunctional UDP-sugar hydrolase/5'-nucleotidase [Methanofollis formosanus]QYZ80312.1 bifunctional metallophosphatase/5'-nucleotidase [Methanofollis formosanus]